MHPPLYGLKVNELQINQANKESWTGFDFLSSVTLVLSP